MKGFFIQHFGAQVSASRWETHPKTLYVEYPSVAPHSGFVEKCQLELSLGLSSLGIQPACTYPNKKQQKYPKCIIYWFGTATKIVLIFGDL